MNATIVLFVTGIGARGVMIVYNNITRHRAKLQLFEDGVVRISIPTNLSWAPGQHVFLRFPSIRMFESHPFTIISIPSSMDAKMAEKQQPELKNEVVVLVRSAAGFTMKLVETAAEGQDVTVPVLLDGPYGHDENTLRAYDSVLILAGGSGITYGVSLLKDLVKGMKLAERSRCKTVEFYWAIRNKGVPLFYASVDTITDEIRCPDMG